MKKLTHDKYNTAKLSTNKLTLINPPLKAIEAFVRNKKLDERKKSKLEL